MLYDNAQLARVYLHAWQLTGDEFYRTMAEETRENLGAVQEFLGQAPQKSPRCFGHLGDLGITRDANSSHLEMLR